MTDEGAGSGDPGALTPGALARARGLLRQIQAGGATSTGSVLPAVLTCLARYREFEETADPNTVRRSGYCYSRVLELQRIGLAEQLAKRVDPGPLEQPARFASLAYAAASIELALPDTPMGTRPFSGWDRMLLGTVRSRDFNSGYGLIEEHGFSLVWINSALIDIIDQAATAVSMATAVPPLAGTSARENLLPDRVRDLIRENPGAVDHLYGALEAYIFEGRPRAFPEEAFERRGLALSTLISMAYRWVIGHEYGHGFVATLRDKALMIGQREELIADLSATIQTAYAATRLDGLPPELGAGGGAFFLACHEILDRAVSIARSGSEAPGAGDVAHPPAEARVVALVDAFGSMVVSSAGPDGIDLSIRDRLEPPDPNATTTKSMHDQMLGHARALFEIWFQVKPRLFADFQAKRAVHEMWK
jgi:hypothetical protein